VKKIYKDRREAADYLTKRGFKTTWSTLQKYGTTGGGPQYQLFGNRAVYLEQDLDSWAESKLSAPRFSTSEVAR
jgi:hypothetical protein